VHPLHGPELRALRPLQDKSSYVFVTEAGTPVTTAWFLRMVQRTGRAAKLPSLFIRTCLGIRRDTSSPMLATIRGRWRTILGIGICSQRLGIQRSLRICLRDFGKIRIPVTVSCCTICDVGATTGTKSSADATNATISYRWRQMIKFKGGGPIRLKEVAPTSGTNWGRGLRSRGLALLGKRTAPILFQLAFSANERLVTLLHHWLSNRGHRKLGSLLPNAGDQSSRSFRFRFT